MKERIEELAHQAYDHDTMIGFHYIPEEFKEKFAKLIVAECVSEIQKQTDGEGLDDWDRGYNCGINSSIESIKKHFGMEQ